ncbi:MULTISPECIES: hypothetical protein [Streptococcus]|uniref:Uncharacterized protein n=1 Tax=Streptococcus caledonicus TaxID=2614158 RepID=A0ABW0UCM7_9STRE|nr:hypothetical protein [Streptococcus sp. S784/96/1]
MPDKNWQTFVIVLGFFLIAISPITPFKLLNVITGIVLILLGFVLLKKK